MPASPGIGLMRRWRSGGATKPRTQDRTPIRHPAEIFLFGQKRVRAGVFRTSWGQSTGHSESSHEFGAAGIQYTSATGPVRAHGDSAPGGHIAGTGPVAVSAAKRPSAAGPDGHAPLRSLSWLRNHHVRVVTLGGGGMSPWGMCRLGDVRRGRTVLPRTIGGCRCCRCAQAAAYCRLKSASSTKSGWVFIEPI